MDQYQYLNLAIEDTLEVGVVKARDRRGDSGESKIVEAAVSRRFARFLIGPERTHEKIRSDALSLVVVIGIDAR